MLQPLFNPLQNKHEVTVEDECATLSSVTSHVWQDHYDCAFELQYYGVDVELFNEQDYNMGIDYPKHKNVLLSLFTTNSLNCKQFFKFIASISSPNGQYEELKEPIPEKQYDIIYNDVKRTFKSSAYFKDPKVQTRLADVLIAYSNIDPQVGYGQGMNFIAGGLMYLAEGQDDKVFDVLQHILMEKEWRQLFVDGTPGLFQCIAQFNYKFRKHLPKLSQHFKEIGIEDLSMCISHYYLTLFMQNTPLQFAIVIISMFVVEGEQILTKLIMSMLKYFENYLLTQNDFNAVTNFIKRSMVTNFYKEIQKCRKEERLIKVLLEIKLVKRRKIVKQPNHQQNGIMRRIITKPYRVGHNIYKYWFGQQ